MVSQHLSLFPNRYSTLRTKETVRDLAREYSRCSVWNDHVIQHRKVLDVERNELCIVDFGSPGNEGIRKPRSVGRLEIALEVSALLGDACRDIIHAKHRE